MRAPKNEATGKSGETEVLGEFQKLGWAGLLDDRHDTGTDLYLRPRDNRRFELGVVMGAQVKTGPSYFSSPHVDAQGETAGWWYKESDRRHFDDWIRHALPHVLILRDQDKQRSYWVHVTAERVESTGKGTRILVPANQTVDKTQNQTLSDVALTQLPAPTLDGSVWTGALHLSPMEEIRHALIAPRLIAPHRNLAPETITGTEALAMHVFLREELERSLAPTYIDSLMDTGDKVWQGKRLEDAKESNEWSWRATAALHQWLCDGDPTDLSTLGENCSSPDERAASAVLQAVYFFDRNKPDPALEVLESILKWDDYEPVDHAWLQAQRARAMLEVGRREEAFDLAMETQRIHRESPSDVTAAAIAGACALTSFRAAGWMHGDVGSIVQRSDNAPSWWRSQVFSYGLSDHLNGTFHGWTDASAFPANDSAGANNRLLSAALMSSLAGDHDSWRGMTQSLGKHLLVASAQEETPSAIAGYLSRLRRAGDSKSARRAAQRILNEGPVAAAGIAALEVDLQTSTRTSALSDLEFLTVCADVLDQETADTTAAWTLQTLRSSKPYVQRTRPTFHVESRILDLLRGLLPAVSDQLLHEIVEHFLDGPPVTDALIAQTLAPLIRAVPGESWSNEQRERAAARANEDGTLLREAYLAVAAPESESTRQEIVRRARSGDLGVLHAISNVTTLPPDAVASLTDQLVLAIDKQLGEATNGSYSVGTLDFGYELTLLSIWHPSNSHWDKVEALLSTPQVACTLQLRTLRLLADQGSLVPPEARERLVQPVDRLRRREPRKMGFGGAFDGPDIRGVAAEAMAALSNETVRATVVREVLSGDAAHRASGARIIGRFGHSAESELLLALSADGDSGVRNSALAGLSRLVDAQRAPQAVIDVLIKHLERGGQSPGLSIVQQLRNQPDEAMASELLTIALQHPSARVRAAARSAANVATS